MKEINEAYMNN